MNAEKTVAIVVTVQDDGLFIEAGPRRTFLASGATMSVLAELLRDPRVQRFGGGRAPDFFDTMAEGLRGLFNGQDGDDSDCDAGSDDGVDDNGE